MCKKLKSRNKQTNKIKKESYSLSPKVRTNQNVHEYKRNKLVVVY